jgi:hypothetical protein
MRSLAMEKKKESAMEYYALFRDVSEPASHGTLASAHRRHDLLIGDTAAYVWRCVGELTSSQAKIVQAKIDLIYEEKFEKEYHTALVRQFEGKIINPKRQSVPVISHEHSDYEDRVLPETEEERQQVLGKLFSRSLHGAPKISFHSKPNVPKFSQKRRSFVRLLPLSILTDIWQRVGCAPNMEPLRHTAAVWYLETLHGSEIFVHGQKFSSEESEIAFKSSLDDQELSDFQREVLGKCDEIAKRVGGVVVCGNLNIPNKNEAATRRTANPSALREVSAAKQGEKKESTNIMLRRLLEKYSDREGWSSEELGHAIGATGAAVRKTPMWKELRERKKRIKEQNAIILKLKNDQLPYKKREALQTRLDELGYKQDK